MKKLVKFSKLFAKIQLENIENFDENGQLSVFQGKIGQFSKLLFAKIMRNLEEKKKKNYRSFDEKMEKIEKNKKFTGKKPSPFSKMSLSQSIFVLAQKFKQI